MARFQLDWVSTDITNDVLLYNRTSSICEGVRTLVLETKNVGRNFVTWDALTLWEDTIKVGKFFIVDIKYDHDGRMKITAQDSSLRLERNFEDKTWTPGYVSTAKYWISLWLDRAGVSYNFTATGNGSTVNKNVTFGNDNTFNLIVPLLQQSGWYMIFDSNNVLQIGELSVDTDNPDANYTERDIISISYSKKDQPSRNKVVVWGGMDRVTDTWITGSAEASAGWQIDSNDDRTVVISSNAINNYSSAYLTANKLLNTVIELSKEKTLSLTGFRNIQVGDSVHVSSRVYNGTGLVTDVEVSSHADTGFITTITLDRRCPRLFAYFAWDGYVYVGTRGGGVWRKPLESSTWSSYSSGLTNLNILDLYISEGIYVCVTGDGYAYRSTDATSSWVKLSHGEMTDSTETVHDEIDVKAVACTIDDEGTIIVGYTHAELELSWMVHFNIYSGIERKEQIILENNDTDVVIYDLDNTGDTTVIAIKDLVPLDDATKGEFPSCYIPTDGDMNFFKAELGGNEIGYGRYHNYRSHFHNASYLLDHPTLIHQDYNPRSRVGTYPPYYGPLLTYGQYHYSATLSSTLGSLPYKASFGKLKSHDGSGVASVAFPPWGTSSNPPTQGAHRRYALYDEDTIIAVNSKTVYKVDFSLGSYSTIGTLSTPATHCHTTPPVSWYGPYIEAMWGGNGNPIVIFYYYSLGESHYSVSEQPFCAYYTAVYDGSFSDVGEFGACPYDPQCVDSQISVRNASPARGNLSQSTATVAIYSAEYDDYIYETSPEPTLLNSTFGSWNINLSTGAASLGGSLEPETDYAFSHSSVDYAVHPSSRKMIVVNARDDYYYTITDGGISESNSAYSGEDITVNHVKWGGGLANVNMTTGAITVVDGSFPISNTTFYPISNISTTASDEDGAIVYWCGTLASGIVVENGATVVQIKPTATQLGYPTILDSIQLVGNRIFTGGNIITVSGYLKPNDSPSLSGTILGGAIIKDEYFTSVDTDGTDLFATILSGIPGKPRVEISRSSPTIVYTAQTPASYTYSNFTLDENDWNTLGTAFRIPMADARVYFSEDGESIFDGFKVAVATDATSLKAGNSRLDEEFTVVFSGAIVTSGSTPLHRLETSNGTAPYFFASTSGSPITGSQFFQKNNSESNFTEYTTGLPSNNITIIRLDDRIA